MKILQAICTEQALAHLQSLASVRSAAWWHLIPVKGWSCFISAPAEFWGQQKLWVSATRGSSVSSRVSQPLLRWDCSWRCKSGAPACYQRQDFACMKGRYSSSSCPASLGTTFPSWAVLTPAAFHCLPVMFIARPTLCSTLCYLCQTPLSINHLVQAKGKLWKPLMFHEHYLQEKKQSKNQNQPSGFQSAHRQEQIWINFFFTPERFTLLPKAF